MQPDDTTSPPPHKTTRVLRIFPQSLPRILNHNPTSTFPFDDWSIDWPHEEAESSNIHNDISNLQFAARHLRLSDTPVSFPTETVYGLGANATRSAAVRGIFEAKRRPADNPLIVHVCSLRQLRELLRGRGRGFSKMENGTTKSAANGSLEGQMEVEELEDGEDPIPQIYKPLIEKFWPGPLTILLQLPSPSPLAPEVTGSSHLRTFGARMPASLIALYLIRTAGVPVAAPSANASGKPSPTTSEHVLEDLDGRIDIVVDDGGTCSVGVESTVVDGLSTPPAILRPGGVSLGQIRACPGWGNTVKGYKDGAEIPNGVGPRAPGMKYRHYAPKAKVVLFEAALGQPKTADIRDLLGNNMKLGVIRTSLWPLAMGLGSSGTAKDEPGPLSSPEPVQPQENGHSPLTLTASIANSTSSKHQFASLSQHNNSSWIQNLPSARSVPMRPNSDLGITELWDVNLGKQPEDVARGLFSAMRDLDRRGVDVIFVEGIDDSKGGLAAAVMNRMRKAAEVKATI